MAVQIFVGSLPQIQALPVWQQFYLGVPDPQLGIINPSSSIILNDEVYLRDYTLAAAILSWDEGTYSSSEQLTAADITNIAITSDTVWYQINYHRAIPLHIETFHSHRLQIQQYQTYQDKAEPETKPQPAAGIAGDSVSCQLHLPAAQTEFEQGCVHEKLDAAERSHPIYTSATCNYATGYIQGYKTILNPLQQPKESKKLQWTVTYNAKWQRYDVWIGGSCIGNASDHEQAERIAQKYIATTQMIEQQNAAVFAAYAG